MINLFCSSEFNFTCWKLYSLNNIALLIEHFQKYCVGREFGWAGVQCTKGEKNRNNHCRTPFQGMRTNKLPWIVNVEINRLIGEPILSLTFCPRMGWYLEQIPEQQMIWSLLIRTAWRYTILHLTFSKWWDPLCRHSFCTDGHSVPHFGLPPSTQLFQ